MFSARVFLKPEVADAIFLVHSSGGSEVARVAAGEPFQFSAASSNTIIVRVLIPDKSMEDDALVDYGTAVAHVSREHCSYTVDVMYSSTGEVALVNETKARVTVAVEQCAAFLNTRPTDQPSQKTLKSLQKFYEISGNWWAQPNLPEIAQIQGTDGPHDVPESTFHPYVLGIFDLHAPNYSTPRSNLPGWAFALPLAECDPEWLEHIIRLAGARVGCDENALSEIAQKYLNAKDRDEMFSANEIVEIMFDASALPASFMPYSYDKSTGASKVNIERYTLTPRYGAAGDCEDGAKFIQTTFENFASLVETAKTSPILRACADIARRYVGGVSVVAANAGSFSSNAKKTRDVIADDEIPQMGYSDFVSHMAFLALPKFQLNHRGVDGNLRAAEDNRVPERMWEAALPVVVLEGTGLKSSRADIKSVPTLKKTNAVTELRHAPFHTLRGSADNFYLLFNSVSFARGAEYVDARGVSCPVHEAFFTAPRENGEHKYGVLYNEIITPGARWDVRSTFTHTDVPAQYVQENQERVKELLRERGTLPLTALSIPNIEEKEGAAENVLREACAEKNIRYEDLFVHSPRIRSAAGGSMGFVRSTAFHHNTALEIIASLRKMKAAHVHWYIEATAPWHWGISFIVQK